MKVSLNHADVNHSLPIHGFALRIGLARFRRLAYKVVNADVPSGSRAAEGPWPDGALGPYTVDGVIVVRALRFSVLGGIAAAAMIWASTPVRADAVEANGAVQLAAAEEMSEEANDPIEPLNRFFFQFNEAFYTMLLRPMAELYQALIPPPAREAVGNALDNVNSPVVLANDILQGEGTRAWETTERMAINSTLGLGGLFDVAEAWFDIEGHDEDFGQTLAVWGVGEGFYLVLPLYGPSSPRDAVGKLVVDSYLDPLGMWLDNTERTAESWTRKGLSAVDEYGGVMSELDQIKKTSVDYYAAIRSMARQKRGAEIRNGKEGKLPPIPDLGSDEDWTPRVTATRPD
jgi:phospholipid-binding lipoprotein MlaA